MVLNPSNTVLVSPQFHVATRPEYGGVLVQNYYLHLYHSS
jgi:hypothetical protein